MVDHISKLRQLQDELHIMDNKVSDEDFVMILITSLPESWDNYMTSYLGSSGNKPLVRSHELVAILLEEEHRRKGRIAGDTATSLQAQGQAKNQSTGRTEGNDKECFNCKKKEHMAKDCWAKGGGMEGKGPRGQRGPHQGNRTNQAQETNTNLNEVAYEASENYSPKKYDWYFDTTTTSHICI